MYIKYILQSLLIYLSTCDYLGSGDITKIIIFFFRGLRRKNNSGKKEFYILYKGCMFFGVKGKLELSYSCIV